MNTIINNSCIYTEGETKEWNQLSKLIKSWLAITVTNNTRSHADCKIRLSTDVKFVNVSDISNTLTQVVCSPSQKKKKKRKLTMIDPAPTKKGLLYQIISVVSKVFGNTVLRSYWS